MKECVAKWLNEQFCGDQEMMAAVYDEYKDTLARLLNDLAAARQSGDATAIDRALHTIKGSAAMVGDTEPSTLAAESRKLTDPAALEAVEQKLRAFAAAL